MPSDPLIPSPGLRSAVVAGLMGVVLAASLGLAWAVTGASWQRPGPVQENRWAVGAGTISLPAAWRPITAQPPAGEADGTPGTGTPAAAPPGNAGGAIRQFVNASAPDEQLRVFGLATSQPRTPAQVLEGVVLGSVWKRQTDAHIENFQLQGLAYAEVVFATRRTPAAATVLVHAFAVVSPDGRRFVALHLQKTPTKEDRETRGEQLFIDQLQRLREIAATVEMP